MQVSITRLWSIESVFSTVPRRSMMSCSISPMVSFLQIRKDLIIGSSIMRIVLGSGIIEGFSNTTTVPSVLCTRYTTFG